MQRRLMVIEVGWEIDLDGNRHPRIGIRRADWSAMLYDHPIEGWQIIALEIARHDKRGKRFDEYAGTEAESKLRELIEGELPFTDSVLNNIVEDLYEIGRRGAVKRWAGETIMLKVEQVK